MTWKILLYNGLGVLLLISILMILLISILMTTSQNVHV